MNHRDGQYSHRLHRDSPLSRCKRLTVIGGLLLVAIAGQAAAQDDPAFDHPLFTSPIREAEASPIDVRHVRIDVRVDPDEHRITGRLTATFRKVVLEPVRIAVSSDSVAVQNSILYGPGLEDEAAFEWEGGLAYLRLPRQESDSKSEYYFSTEIDQSEGFSTFPLGIEPGSWSSVWTSLEPGGDYWLPFSFSVDDWFTADLRVSVPLGWTVFLPGKLFSSITAERRIVYRAAISSAGPSSRVGFAAVADVPASGDGPRLASLDASLTPDRLSSLMASVTDIRDFIAQRTNIAEDSSRSPFLQAILDRESSVVRMSIFPPTTISPTLNAVARDHQTARTVARAWIRNRLPPPGWTDIWVQEALAQFLALEYIRGRHGNLFYLSELWKLRRRYLDESRLYQRPLVWDKWEHPIDMLDEHARGKGAWILHMLSARLGAATVFESIELMTGMGREHPIGTEELRYALESRSGANLSEFFDRWVYGSGHPVLEFTYSIQEEQNEIDLTILQKQTGFLVPASFTFDLDVEASSLAGIDTARLRISDESTTATMPVALRPQYVRLDPEGRVLFEFEQPVVAADLVSALRRARSDASRYLAVAMLRETSVDPSLLLGMRPVLSRPLPLILRLDLLEVLGGLAPSSSALREILPAVSDSSGLIRAAAITALGSFMGEQEAREAVFDAANSERNPVVLAAAVTSLVRLDPSLAWTVLQSAMITRSEEDVVRRTAIPLIIAVDADNQDRIELLLPLLESDVETETRVAAVSALCSWVENEDVLPDILSVWPTANVRLRSAVLDCMERPAVRSILGRTDPGALSAWSRFEPNPILLRRLRKLLPDSSS